MAPHIQIGSFEAKLTLREGRARVLKTCVKVTMFAKRDQRSRIYSFFFDGDFLLSGLLPEVSAAGLLSALAPATFVSDLLSDLLSLFASLEAAVGLSASARFLYESLR
jgi:hypothetical protein